MPLLVLPEFSEVSFWPADAEQDFLPPEAAAAVGVGSVPSR